MKSSIRARLRGRVRSVIAAFALDHFLGEPSLHPVRAMGWYINRARANRRASTDTPSWLEGLLVLGSGALLSAAAAQVAERLIGSGSWLRDLVRGAALKPALALAELREAGLRVADALEAGSPETARQLVSRDLVSRNTTDLPGSLIASAAIESLAENLSDSVVAPIMMFLGTGLPGAYAYRFVNTADAMIGYHTPELEWYGKTTAQLDDLLNLLPARLSAYALLAAARWNGVTPGPTGSLAREASRTESPNAGWPMAAMALALDVRLEKRQHYVLHQDGRDPGAKDVYLAADLLNGAAMIAVGTLCSAAWALGRNDQ